MPAAVNPRRLLMTADAVGGVWTYALDLARGLAEQGVATALAVLGPPPDAARRRAAEAIPDLVLIQTGLPLDWTAARPCEVEAAGRAVAGLADELGADLVHLNSPALAASARFSAPVVAACHSCVATWWASCRSGPLPSDLAWRAALHGAGLHAADAVIAPSRAFARATADAYALPAPPRAIHNGRPSLPHPRPDQATEALVLTAGRLWDEGKNVQVLDRAASALPWPVVALGALAGPNGAAIQLTRCRTPGPVGAEDMAAWLARAAVYASPARYEPFGLSVLEAAQAGCALVLSDIPTFRELWDGAALFVPSDDDGALAATLTQVLEDPGEHRRLSRAARARAGRFGAEAMVAGTLAVYREALDRRSRVETAA